MPSYNFSGSTGQVDSYAPIREALSGVTSQLDKQKAEDALLRREKLAQEAVDYAKGRDVIADTRYNTQQAEDKSERQRLLDREYNTNRAAQATINPTEFNRLNMIGEQKAIADTMAGASPELRAQIQGELATNYKPEESSKQWSESALGQSNLDQMKITDLNMDMEKQKVQQDQFAENKRLQERGLDIQAKTANEARQDRLDAKIAAAKPKADYENFVDPRTGKTFTVNKNDPNSMSNAAESGLITMSALKNYTDGEGTGGGTSGTGGGGFTGFGNKSSGVTDKTKEIINKSQDSFVTPGASIISSAEETNKVEKAMKALGYKPREMEKIVNDYYDNSAVWGMGRGGLNLKALEASPYGSTFIKDSTTGKEIKESDAIFKVYNDPDNYFMHKENGKTQLMRKDTDTGSKVWNLMNPDDQVEVKSPLQNSINKTGVDTPTTSIDRAIEISKKPSQTVIENKLDGPFNTDEKNKAYEELRSKITRKDNSSQNENINSFKNNIDKNIPESSRNLVTLLDSPKIGPNVLYPQTREDYERVQEIKDEIAKDPTFLFNKNIPEKYKDIVRIIVGDRNSQKDLNR